MWFAVAHFTTCLFHYDLPVNTALGNCTKGFATMNKFTNIVTSILILYFILSGLSALADLEAKLMRIGLEAINDDGRVAFGLIYASLFVGIGLSMIALWYLSKTTVYSLVVAGMVIASFIMFRFFGAISVGELSALQIQFIFIEIIELSIIMYLVFYNKTQVKKFA